MLASESERKPNDFKTAFLKLRTDSSFDPLSHYNKKAQNDIHPHTYTLTHMHTIYMYACMCIYI